MAEESKTRRRAAPKGYQKKNTDVAGYWSEDEPIHFIPRSVKLMDGNQMASRPSIIIVGELVEQTVLFKKDVDPWMGSSGDVVGIWYKPGMKDIALSAGLKTWLDKDLDENGIQRTVKMKKAGRNPMKCYVVQSAPGKETRIPIGEDTRKESRTAVTPFDDPNLRPVMRAPAKTAESEEHDDEEAVDDQIPF